MLAPLIFSAITFLVVVLLCIGIYYFWQRKENLKFQTQRIEQVVNIQSLTSDTSKEKTEEEVNLRRDTRTSVFPWLNNLLLKFSKSKSFKSMIILIEQSGLKIKVGEFIIFCLLIGSMGALIVDLLFHIPVVGFIFAVVPYWFLFILKEVRINEFIKQLPQALDLLSGDLRAGLDVQAGLKHLSEEFAPPIGEEFGKVVAEVNLGLTLSNALNNLANRINAMDVQILCTGIIINRELGGNLSELIGNITETVRERFRLKGMVKALTAENQMSAILLVILPVGLYILLNVLAPSTYASFNTDPIGQMVLGGCVVSMTIGWLIIKKITKLEV